MPFVSIHNQDSRYMRSLALAGIFCTASIAGCADDIATSASGSATTMATGETTGASASSGETITGTTAPSDTSTTVPPDTDTTTTDTTTTDTTTTDTEGTTGGSIECEEGSVSASYELTPEPPNIGGLAYDWECIVDDVATKGPSVVISLACQDGDVPIIPDPQLTVTTDPFIDIAGIQPLAQVNLTYRTVSFNWVERWLRLESAGSGDLLFAAVEGGSLEPDEESGIFAPYDVDTVTSLCAPESTPCGDEERLGVRFTRGDQAWAVLDQGYSVIDGLPGLDVWVESARGYTREVACEDTSQRWFKAMLILAGGA